MIMDILEDGWDMLMDAGEYLFSFEWIGDVWEGTIDFFGSMFEGIGEFSFLGMTFGILAVLASYGTKFLNFGIIEGSTKQITLIASMVQYMPPIEQVIWTILSYIAAFIAGYLVGNRFENT